MIFDGGRERLPLSHADRVTAPLTRGAKTPPKELVGVGPVSRPEIKPILDGSVLFYESVR